MPLGIRGGPNAIALLGGLVQESVSSIGDLSLFSYESLRGLLRRAWTRSTLIQNCYTIGVQSVPVVAITGMFIGMVLAVQTYSGYRQMGLTTALGAVINSSVIRELGPALAAFMLCGRVGSAMAA